MKKFIPYITYIMPLIVVAIIVIAYNSNNNQPSDTATTESNISVAVNTNDINMLELTNAVDKFVTKEMAKETTEENNEDEPINRSISYDWGEDDDYLLAKIAMAEAGGEGIEGKAYVIMVVLNRVRSDAFPDTIRDVIYQKTPGSNRHQFSPIDNGKFDEIEPDEECWEALEMVTVDKWDKSQGALFFESCKSADNWHSRNLEYLFTYKGHRFYR